MTQSNYFLGIDGGGSKTEAVIIDDNERVLGVGLSGGSNTTFTTNQVAQASFTASVSRVLAEAALDPEAITAAGCTFGTAAHAAFDDLGLKAHPDHVSEASVAFERAGVLDRVGVVMIAGTGSSCFGRNREGRLGHAGGWGAVLGDDGGGYFIGRNAIRRVLWASEGRMSSTQLTAKALEYFSIESPRQIISVFAGTRVNQTLAAGFAAKVAEAASEGDEAAAEIIKAAGRELAQTSLFVAGQIFAAQEDFPLALAGGVYNAGEALIGEIRRPFAEQFPHCSVVIAEMQPGEAVARIVRRKYNGGPSC